MSNSAASLQGKVALVTGAATGIGKASSRAGYHATAERLLAECGRRDVLVATHTGSGPPWDAAPAMSCGQAAAPPEVRPRRPGRGPLTCIDRQ
jgi:hypothetical protein